MIDSVLRILALTRKELLTILKDRRSRVSIIVPPILQCLIYGYVATYDLNDAPYAVFDRDRRAASQRVVAVSSRRQHTTKQKKRTKKKNCMGEPRGFVCPRLDHVFERRLLSNGEG